MSFLLGLAPNILIEIEYSWSSKLTLYSGYFSDNIFNNSVGSSSWASGSNSYNPTYPSSGTNNGNGGGSGVVVVRYYIP